jgi:YVTN family beta-propeller protein
MASRPLLPTHPAPVIALAALLVLGSALSAAVAGGEPTFGAIPPPTILSAQTSTLPHTAIPNLRPGALWNPAGDPSTPHIVIANMTVGIEASPVVYDSVNGYLYVANYGSDNVSVIDATTNQVVNSIPVGTQPETPVLDAGTDQLFVPNYASDNVTVISGTSNTVVANVAVGAAPNTGADDSTNGEVYIPDYGSSNVTVIMASNDHVVANIPVGGNPQPPTFDSLNNSIFVSNRGSNNVSVISGLSNTVVKTIDRQPTPLLNSPETAAFDPANGDLYIPVGFFDANSPLTVVNGSTYAIVATPIVGGYPSPPTYDPVNGNIYVSNYYSTSDNVSVINGSSNTVVATVPAGEQPLTAGVDTVNGDVYVPNADSDNVSILSGATNAVLFNVSLPIRSSSTISPVTPTFDPANGEVYVTGWLEGNGFVDVLGIPPPATYSVTFSEKGLSSGVTWTVSVSAVPKSLTADGGTDELEWTGLINGTYLYTITEIAGWNQSTLPYTGTVMVSGAAVAEPTLAYTQLTYNITFTESGLPSGTEWWVNLSNKQSFSSIGPTLAFFEPNGTYDYTVATGDKEYAPVLASSSFGVSGSSLSEPVTFNLETYDVTFTETGLPAGTSWKVTFGGSSESTTGSTFTVAEPNGSYPFTVGAVPGYTISPSSGSVNVSGKATTRGITFTGPPSSTSSSSRTPWWEYALIGIAVLALILGLLLVALRRRRSPPEPSPSPPTPPAAP